MYSACNLDLEYEESMSFCKFCDIIDRCTTSVGPFQGLFKYGEIESEVIVETPNFALLMDIGPLVKGNV